MEATVEDALAKAAAEGLTLVRAGNTVGYKGVAFKQGRSRPYELKITVEGHTQHFGYYATAEEAALEYARHVGSEQAAQEAALHMARCRRDASIEFDNIEGLEFRSQSTKHRRRLLSMGDSRRVAPHVFERSRLGCSTYDNTH